eukprot:4969398-Pyramimonas_sp.AAC.1
MAGERGRSNRRGITRRIGERGVRGGARGRHREINYYEKDGEDGDDDEIEWHGCPRAYSCFLDESLNAMLGSHAVFAHRARFDHRVFSLWDLQGVLSTSRYFAPGITEAVNVLSGI